MKSNRLPNYLLSNRKRLVLSQQEVAFLLGFKHGEIVCRHERYLQAPSFRIAMAYEVIYKRSICELFAGTYDKVESEVAKRASELLVLKKKDSSKPGEKPQRAILMSIASVGNE